MEARAAEMALLVEATGSASELVTTDRAVLKKMRHADKEPHVAKRAAKGAVHTNGDDEKR
jgi:hypothetical protein